MTKIILDWLKDNYPIIFLCLAVAAVVWFVAKLYFQRFKKVEDTVSKLPCDTHLKELRDIKATVSQVEETVSKLPCSSRLEEIQSVRSSTGKLDSICEQLSEITRWIMKLDPTEIDALAPKFSPRRMTTAGLNLYDISGAKAVVDNNEDALIEAVRAENPQTPLDVEDKAYVVLAGKLSEPIFNEIKNYIYFQPEKVTVKGDGDAEVTVSLSLALLLRLMSIDLRDRYLAKYPSQQENP